MAAAEGNMVFSQDDIPDAEDRIVRTLEERRGQQEAFVRKVENLCSSSERSTRIRKEIDCSELEFEYLRARKDSADAPAEYDAAEQQVFDFIERLKKLMQKAEKE